MFLNTNPLCPDIHPVHIVEPRKTYFIYLYRCPMAITFFRPFEQFVANCVEIISGWFSTATVVYHLVNQHQVKSRLISEFRFRMYQLNVLSIAYSRVVQMRQHATAQISRIFHMTYGKICTPFLSIFCDSFGVFITGWLSQCIQTLQEMDNWHIT